MEAAIRKKRKGDPWREQFENLICLAAETSELFGSWALAKKEAWKSFNRKVQCSLAGTDVCGLYKVNQELQEKCSWLYIYIIPIGSSLTAVFL